VDDASGETILLAWFALPASGEGEENIVPDVEGLVLDLGTKCPDDARTFVPWDCWVLE